MKIDKITLEILKNHSRAAAESMAYTLYRTAHSTFVKETEDFTCGITTPDGETFASPVELGVTWFVGLNYKTVIEMIDEYEEGDICITNDPYSGHVSTHSPDMHCWKPVPEHFQKSIRKAYEFLLLRLYDMESSTRKFWISCSLMYVCQSKIGAISKHKLRL